MPSLLFVTGEGCIQSITPNSGSLHGGTLITIIGNGFTSKSNVHIGNSICRVTSASISQLECITSAVEEEGRFTIQIVY